MQKFLCWFRQNFTRLWLFFGRMVFHVAEKKSCRIHYRRTIACIQEITPFREMMACIESHTTNNFLSSVNASFGRRAPPV